MRDYRVRFRTYVTTATTHHIGIAAAMDGPDRSRCCRKPGRWSETMEWYHESSHRCSRAGHPDLGAELRPARLLRRGAVQQLIAGQPELRRQRLLTSTSGAGERLTREAAGPHRPAAFVLSCSLLLESLLPESCRPLIQKISEQFASLPRTSFRFSIMVQT